MGFSLYDLWVLWVATFLTWFRLKKSYVLELWKEGKYIIFPVSNKKLINFEIAVLLGKKPDVLVVEDDVWESGFFDKYVYCCDDSV